MSFYAPLPSAALRVTGSDRVPFLHGQVSNDVRALSVPGGLRAVILNARGQIEFDLRLYRRDEDLYLHTHAGLGAALFERLKRYVVFDDVQLEDISEKLRVFHVSSDLAEGLGWRVDGEGAGAVQQVVNDFGTLLLARAERGLRGGIDVHALATQAGALEASLAARAAALDPVTLELARLRAGLPDAHLDGFLGRLPQECGLEFAVSYRKGCYIGQEIMARLEARGNARYALQAVTLPQPVSVGSAVTSEGKEVGQLGANLMDAGRAIGLAVLRRDLEPGAALSVEGVRLMVSAPTPVAG